jgi:hypothetical protein
VSLPSRIFFEENEDSFLFLKGSGCNAYRKFYIFPMITRKDSNDLPSSIKKYVFVIATDCYL